MTVDALAERVLRFDGVAAFNEATLLALAAGGEPRTDIRLTLPDGQLAAIALGFDSAPVELAVDPRFRRGGLGRRLLDAARTDGDSAFWAHGDLHSAQKLAAASRLTPQRTLLQLASATPPPGQVADGIRPFRESDLESILAINAAAFATHPEQGAMDRADFDRRAASDWFDPAGLLVRESEGTVVGFHWVKVEDGVGEVYVLAVDPAAAGRGHGAALLAAGLDHLARRAVAETRLYVEADNDSALALYRAHGFTEHARDVVYG